MGTGQLDSQMLHIYGNVTGPPIPGNFRGLWDEYARATGLCDWLEKKGLRGKGWGVQGIVRMNAGFEMIWCDFSSDSVRLVSHLNVTAPLLGEVDEDGSRDHWKRSVAEKDEDEPTTSYFPLPPLPTRTDRVPEPTAAPGMPPNWRMRDSQREPFLKSQGWNWFLSSTTHYGSSGLGRLLGESRVKLLTCGFLNYYSPSFQSSALSRAEMEREALNLTIDGLWKGPGNSATRNEGLTFLTRRRRAHTLANVSTSDATIMREDSERVLAELMTTSPNCSGLDWTITTNEIVQTYAQPLASFLKTLQSFSSLPTNNDTALKNWMTSLRDDTHSFLLPFLLYPEGTDKHFWKKDSKLFRDTYARCHFHHTRLLDPEEGIILSPEENTLKWAVEETSSGICSVLVEVGLAVEGIWFESFNTPSLSLPRPKEKLEKAVKRWKEGVEELMTWLGWAGEWVACPQKCAWDETCFIPMWPLIARLGRGGGRPDGPPGPPGRGGKPNHGDGPPGRGGEHDGPGDAPPHDGGPPDGRKRPDFDHGPGDKNQTGDRPRGPPRWMVDESDLWEPRCVKAEYIMG